MLVKDDKLVCINNIYVRGKTIPVLNKGEICEVYRIIESIKYPYTYSAYIKSSSKTLLLYDEPSDYYYIWNYFITLEESRRIKINNLKNKIKMKLLPNYKQLERLTLKEFVERIKSTPNRVSKSGKEYTKISDRKKHWIYLIENNNLICPVTGKTVDYCSYDREDFKNPKTLSTFHYNFYSADDELFSIDHKHPISKGGSKRDFDNIQPMVMLENFKKKNEMIYL